MPRPSALPPEEKTRLVLSVLAGELSVRCDPLMVPDTGQGGQQAACSKEDMQRWEDDPGSLRRRSAMPCWRC